MIWFIIIGFVLLFIFFLAFSSDSKQTQVTKIDPNTGNKTIEIHETVGTSPAQSAARGILGCFGIIILLFIVLFIIGALHK